MPKYLISFNDGDMSFPDEDFPAVRDAVRELRREAKSAGAWVFGGGLDDYSARSVGTDGSVKDGPLQESPVRIGGFSVIEAASDEEALIWARKIAVACRCAQEVRRFNDDRGSDSPQN